MSLRYKGVNYDVGIDFNDHFNSRPTFDTDVIKRELQIIRDDLHCTDVRLSGTSIERLVSAGKIALELNLGVWFSPQLHNKSAEETAAYILESARALETLRVAYPDKVSFVVGCELTWFMKDIMNGETYEQRLGSKFNLFRLIVTRSYSKKLDAFLAKLVPAVRKEFRGKITYAGALLEKIDWTPFDFIGLDYYRDKSNRQKYGKELAGLRSYKKPIIITEVGVCTYRGAELKGALGHTIVYKAKDGRHKLKPGFVRDEAMQARELLDMLSVLDAYGVTGTFVFLFAWPAFPYSEDPSLDLDMASYSLVKSFKGKKNTTYSALGWEPKESFLALGAYYEKIT
jgi:hypothetical protein